MVIFHSYVSHSQRVTDSQVTKKPSLGGQVWADGSIYAVGDCNYGCIGEPGNWEMPPVPKISYPGALGWQSVLRGWPLGWYMGVYSSAGRLSLYAGSCIDCICYGLVDG